MSYSVHLTLKDVLVEAFQKPRVSFELRISKVKLSLFYIWIKEILQGNKNWIQRLFFLSPDDPFSRTLSKRIYSVIPIIISLQHAKLGVGKSCGNGYSSSSNISLRDGRRALKKFLAETSSPLDILVKVRA